MNNHGTRLTSDARTECQAPAGLTSSCARRMWLHFAVSGNMLEFERTQSAVSRQASKALQCRSVINNNVKTLCQSSGHQRIRLHRKCGEASWYAQKVCSTPSKRRRNNESCESPFSANRSSSPGFTPVKCKFDKSSVRITSGVDWKAYKHTVLFAKVQGGVIPSSS